MEAEYNFRFINIQQNTFNDRLRHVLAKQMKKNHSKTKICSRPTLLDLQSNNHQDSVMFGGAGGQAKVTPRS